jgi:hypothetical protein
VLAAVLGVALLVAAAVLGVALLVAVSVLWHWHTQTAHEGAAHDHPGVAR